VAVRWNDIRTYWAGKVSGGTATSYTNQLKNFYLDQGETLWFTIHKHRLYWTLLGGVEPPLRDEASSFRKCSGWSCSDLNGNETSKSRLAGFIVAKEIFPGTSCPLKDKERDYILHRINGRKLPEVEHAEKSLEMLESDCLNLIKLLDWRDFETLGGLIFETSGWRRVSEVGGSQPTTDIELVLPTTNQRAFVQIKSSTDQRQFDSYESEFRTRRNEFDWMFFVFHTGQITTKNPKVRILGPGEIEKMVVNVGLTQWVIEKVS